MQQIASGSLALVFILISIVFVLPIQAQSISLESEHIQAFQSDITIQEDGTIDVVETITYDFQDQERHGILRYIPYLLSGENNQRLKITITDISVTGQGGTGYQFDQTDDNGTIELKIGDPDQTISGIQQYEIAYTAAGALRYGNQNFDELYWNVTGNQWDVPIARAQTQITLPETVSPDDPIIKATCFTGETGSQSQDCQISQTGTQFAVTTTEVLQADEGLTVAMAFPKGSVAVLEPEVVVSFWDTPEGQVARIVLLVIGGILALGWFIVAPIWILVQWMRYGRDPDVGRAVTAWYGPPENQSGRTLSAAETGALIDETVDFRDISALIVQLAQQGYYHIRQETKGGILGSPFGKSNEFYLVKKKEFSSDSTLQSFERQFLDDVFGNVHSTVRVKDLTLHQTISTMKRQIYDQLVQQDFFPKNPQTIRQFYTIIMVLALVTANIPLALISGIFGRRMPRKTRYGAKQAQVAKGLENFLKSQERQIQFQGQEQMLFEKLLPYAIAFGVEEHWAHRFASIHLRPPTWYEGDFSNGFTTAALINSIHDSTQTVSSVSTPPSSSSSGFSGGFSGGGAGGGGGGSW